MSRSYYIPAALLRVVLFFILGIIVQYHFSFFSEYLHVFFIVLLVLFVFLIIIYFLFSDRYGLRIVFGLLVCLFFFVLGMSRIQQHLYLQNILLHDDRQQPVVGYLTERPVRRTASFSAIYQVTHIRKEGQWHRRSAKIQLIFPVADSLMLPQTGMRFLCLADRHPIPDNAIKGMFDYKKNCSVKGIVQSAFVSHRQCVPVENTFFQRIRKKIINSRYRLCNVLQQQITDDRVVQVASAMLLACRSDLDADTKSLFSSSGAMHILAVSGLHIGILFLLLSFLLNALPAHRYTRLVNSLVIMLFLWIYVMLIGFPASATRAVLMFSFVSSGKLFSRKVHTMHSVIASAFFILLANPLLIADVGFQLSYAAVISIILFYPLLFSLSQPGNILFRYLWSLVCLSVSAQLGVAPLVIYYFHMFPLYFLLTNLVVVPAAFLMLCLALAFFLFSWWPVLSVLLAWFLTITIQAVFAFLHLINDLPSALISDIRITEFELVAIVSLILISYFLFRRFNYGVLCVFFSVLGFFLLADIYDKYRIAKQKYIYFHKEKNCLALDFICGKNSVVLTHGGICEVLDKKIAAHHFYAGVTNTCSGIVDDTSHYAFSFVKIYTCRKNVYVDFLGKRLVWLLEVESFSDEIIEVFQPYGIILSVKDIANIAQNADYEYIIKYAIVFPEDVTKAASFSERIDCHMPERKAIKR